MNDLPKLMDKQKRSSSRSAAKALHLETAKTTPHLNCLRNFS